MASQLEAQIGIATETTYGTRVTPTRFYPFVSEGIVWGIDTFERQDYMAGRLTSTGRRTGGARASGPVELELAPQGIGLLLKHMFGSVSTTGAGPYVHTFTPGSLTGLSFTLQKGVTDDAGTTRPFDFAGCKVTGWKIDADTSGLARLAVDVYGNVQDTGQSLASASYPSGWQPFSWTEGSLTVGGTATPVRSLSIEGTNGLTVDRFRMQTTNPARSKEPVQSAVREYGGELVADFNGLTDYNRFVNGTAAALVVTFNAGASAQLSITANVEFDGETPTASGRGSEIEQKLPFRCLHATADASALTVAVTNGDSSP